MSIPMHADVFVVEDSPMMLDILKAELEGLGFKNIKAFQKVEDAWDAIHYAAVASSNPVIIFSDWQMVHGMSGLDLLKKVRGTAATKAIPVIMVTAERDKTKVIEALVAGASGYVVKPFQRDNITKVLEGAFKKSG